MNYASQILKDEHEAILTGLNFLDSIQKSLDGPAPSPKKDLEDMVTFFTLFADSCHHGKEEGKLFPAMEQAGIPNQGGPIGQMLHEHELGRSYMKGMKEALAGDGVDIPAFRRYALEYISFLRTHIEKENTVLFPMGDQFIPEEDQAGLIAAFEHHEETVMGKGIHEELHAMLDDFALRYPK